jgi:predicted PurR-regulated permease PerM
LGGDYCVYDLANLSVGTAFVWSASPKSECLAHDFTDYFGDWCTADFWRIYAATRRSQSFFELQKQIFSGHLDVPDFIRELPIIGKEVSRILNDINNDPNSITQNVAAWIQGHMGYGRFVLSEISRNLVKLGFALLSLYFFYRDGPIILSQVSKAMEMVIGPRVHHYLDTISETTRAVVYGVGLTAVAQAILAGLSYFIAGVPNPMVLTIVTFLLALIPFGTPVAYTSVALWLFSQDHMMGAIGVMLWGVCIVSR